MHYTIIDVREPNEYAAGHVEGAINIPSASLMAGSPELKNIPKDANLIVYCKTGSRSEIAINIFRELGYSNMKNGINKEQTKRLLGL